MSFVIFRKRDYLLTSVPIKDEIGSIIDLEIIDGFDIYIDLCVIDLERVVHLVTVDDRIDLQSIVVYINAQDLIEG